MGVMWLWDENVTAKQQKKRLKGKERIHTKTEWQERGVQE